MAALLVGVFLGAVWFGFRGAIVGRSVAVPDLSGKTPEGVLGVAHAAGLQLEEQESRARFDERIPNGPGPPPAARGGVARQAGARSCGSSCRWARASCACPT